MTTAVSNLSTPETDHADSSRPIGWFGIASTALLVGAPAAAQANVFVQPNLPVGSAYRLIFLTSSQTDGSSPDITVYNTMVTNAAANNPLLPAATWRAIVSTPTINAIDNIACTPSCSSDPIYLVTGSEVATSTADLFDGTVLTPISITESGSTTGMYYTTQDRRRTGPPTPGQSSAMAPSASAKVMPASRQGASTCPIARRQSPIRSTPSVAN